MQQNQQQEELPKSNDSTDSATPTTRCIRSTREIVGIVGNVVVSAATLGIGIWQLAIGNIAVGAPMVSSIVGYWAISPINQIKK